MGQITVEKNVGDIEGLCVILGKRQLTTMQRV